MEIAWDQWYQLIIVVIFAGIVISVMIFMRAAGAGGSKSAFWKTLMSFWAALVATVASMIVASSYAGGTLFDVTIQPFGVEAAPMKGPTAVAAVISVIITITLWGLTIRQLNMLNDSILPGVQETGQEDSNDDSD